MAEKTLRRGKPETRTNYERAKDDFGKAKGETRVVERIVDCPTCGAVMTKRTSYRAPEHVRVELICSAHAKHSEERFGFYSTEGA